MKLYSYLLGALCLMAATACGGQGGNQSSTDEARRVNLYTVSSDAPQPTLRFPAKVKATHDIDIAFRVSGMIQKVYVKEGEPVREGQLLAELDPTDYAVQLSATEAEYKQIKGEAERVMALYKENGTTPVANEKAMYGLQQIEAKYKNHKDQLGYTKLYAPFSGFVQKRLFDANETVAAGMPVISLISRDMPEVELNIPAADYVRRSQFERFSCTFDVYPGKTYELKLIGITEKANANQLYAMRQKLVGGTEPIPSPGMNTNVTITCKADQETTWAVPRSALIEEGGQSYLYRYEGGCVARLAAELVRPNSDGTILIHCEGLHSGDQVVASGVHFLKEGDSVQALPAVTITNEGGLL